MPYWGVFGNNIEKLLSYLKAYLISKFGAKIKILNLGPKMLDLGVFGLEFEKITDIIKISVLKFALL